MRVRWFAAGIGAAIALFIILGVTLSAYEDETDDEKPSPSATVIARTAPPTATLAPPTATPTAAAPRGLGVTRQAIQSAFEQPGIDFSFEASPLADGTPRVLGDSPDGATLIEIIGPAGAPTTATIIIGIPPDSGGISLESVYVAGFLEHAAPGWSEGPAWVGDNMTAALVSGEAETTAGDLFIKMIGIVRGDSGLLILTVTAKE